MSSSSEFSSSPDVIGYLVLSEDGQIMNSGGDLEKADDVARTILNMLKICDTSSFITELNSNWINIVFNNYYYSIRNMSNKQTVILKKHMHKQYYEQLFA